MNIYFLIAGVLCFLLGIIHSILGEYMIFNDKRIKGTLVPSKKSASLKVRHLRILWATWHLASIFGWCFGFFLVRIAVDYHMVNSEFMKFIISSTAYTMFISSIIVLIGTKGKHPGWIVFLFIGILLMFGS
ncbi:hypothetical protein [Flagellimonas pacifica]|uniref:Uncharacterized protein n=1 Tax=Flagellimonas pacifica TaxID=1247520 RepID=A0A285MXH2_9FLAO|nr:hypothetical protein [Allomuricauda parva]SNZ01788.1 hypothetical protein SAMN06265377_3635 [Allomuricauda parva]